MCITNAHGSEEGEHFLMLVKSIENEKKWEVEPGEESTTEG